MAELKNIALLTLIIAVIKNAYAYPACYEENCCCEPPRCCERPVSYLPVPQPLPIRVPVPRPCCQPPSVTIPNIILALLPPTGNKVGGSPYGKQGGVGYGRFGHGFGHGLGHGFGHGYGHGCGFGHGFGHGLGHGFGHGYGHGCGFGHGFGHSCGCYSTGCCGC